MYLLVKIINHIKSYIQVIIYGYRYIVMEEQCKREKLTSAHESIAYVPRVTSTSEAAHHISTYSVNIASVLRTFVHI